MNTPRTLRLIQLKARLNDTIEFRTLPDGTEVDDEGHPILKTAAGVGALGAAGAAGTYAVGARAQGVTAGNLVNKARYDYGMGGVRNGLGATLSKGAAEIKNAGRGKLAALLEKLKGVKLASREGRILQLSAKLDEVIALGDDDNHYVARTFVGTPITSAITARKRKKLQAFAHQYGRQVGNAFVGAGAGAGVGAGAGALASLLSRGKIKAKTGAAVGAFVGGETGALGGSLKANYDRRSTEIMKKYQRPAATA